MTDTRTLEEAFAETHKARWAGRRCELVMASQAYSAIRSIHSAVRSVKAIVGEVLVCHVTTTHIQIATSVWYKEGLAPATINKRLNCLSAMGVDVTGCRKRLPRKLKWWLNPEQERKVTLWLRMNNDPNVLVRRIVADYIEWTTRTGLRVEETLGLNWRDMQGFHPDSRGPGMTVHQPSVTVPGLKTVSAQATLPLGDEAARIIARRYTPPHNPVFVFPITYEQLNGVWQHCREYLGVADQEGSTLKALRRSAARYLHVTKGMPLDVVRQYLRHEDIETTMGYLRLTGGYGTEEMRRWL